MRKNRFKLPQGLEKVYFFYLKGCFWCFKILVATLLIINTATAQAESYKWIKTEKNIQLFERHLLHHGEKVREVKVTFQVCTSAQKMMDLLKDETQIKCWNKRVENFSVFNKEKNSWVSYTQFDLPWPMNNQETLLKYEVQEMSPGKKWRVFFSSINSEKFPMGKEVQRVQYVKGQWMMEQQTHNTLMVTYQITSEKSTSIPKAIADPIVRDNLIASMSLLKQTLEK